MGNFNYDQGSIYKVFKVNLSFYRLFNLFPPSTLGVANLLDLRIKFGQKNFSRHFLPENPNNVFLVFNKLCNTIDKKKYFKVEWKPCNVILVKVTSRCVKQKDVKVNGIII